MIINYTTGLIGSKNPRIEVRTSLEGIVLTPEDIEAELREKERLAKERKMVRKRKPISKEVQADSQEVVNRDDNPPRVGLTKGWLYVPSIGMEFSPTLEGLKSNWYDAHKLVKSKGLVMPSPAETWALIFEAKAQLKNNSEFRKIYEFFTRKTRGDSWHSEWQDAYFVQKGKKMYMHRLEGFKPNGDVILDKGIDITGTYLTSDCYADISQRANITPEGLCKVKDSRTSYVKGENIYSWYPRNGAVARFYANSDRAGFLCGRNPTNAGASLGVRFARRVAPSVAQKNGGKK